MAVTATMPHGTFPAPTVVARARATMMETTMTTDTYVAATHAGGNTVYGDLKPGDRFHFPNRPDVVYTKGTGGWYLRAAGAHLAYPRPAFRTGSKTAVVLL
jgi:hypothetical protein